MSSGGGYQGGRTKMGTKVILNVYDLSPINDYLYTIGFGLHHTGVEIQGSEYSFAGGGGIFSSTPKDAPGAIFRESIEMGVFEGSNSDIQSAIDDLRNDFGPNAYNLVYKNCNHFANAFCWALLRKPIPSHCNRLADYGACLSCFLPKKLLDNAPVGPNDGAGGGGGAPGFQVFPGRQQGNGAKPTVSTSAFSGSGAKLGGTNEESNSSLFGSLIGRSSENKNNSDDLTDRRERARKAALARFERGNADTTAMTSESSNGTASVHSSDGIKSS